MLFTRYSATVKLSAISCTVLVPRRPGGLSRPAQTGRRRGGGWASADGVLLGDFIAVICGIALPESAPFQPAHQRSSYWLADPALRDLAAVAEFERDVISKRARDALAVAKAKGKVLGTTSVSRRRSARRPLRATKPCEEPSPTPRTSRRALPPTRLTVAASRRRAASNGTRCRSIVSRA